MFWKQGGQLRLRVPMFLEARRVTETESANVLVARRAAKTDSASVLGSKEGS